MSIKYIYIGILALLFIGIGYYAISPLFRNIRADEHMPEITNVHKTKTGEVIGTTGHPAVGTVSFIEGDDRAYIRYENFKTINGPDLFVYLAKDLDAKEFVNLGRLRATEGNINYEIPTGVNLNEYRYALVWCRTFRVLFNSAELQMI